MGFESEEEVIAAIDKAPFARALIHPNGEVHLRRWHPALRLMPTEQDTYKAIVAQGIKIVDLRRLVSPSPKSELVSVRELFVSSLDVEGNELTPEAQVAIATYASHLGYSRCWTDGFGLFELPGEVCPDSVATAECDHCHTDYTESSFEFWDRCLKAGMMPAACPVCQTSMSWSVAMKDADERGAALAAIEDITLEDWDSHEGALLLNDEDEVNDDKTGGEANGS